MDSRRAVLVFVGGIVLVSSAGFALFTEVSPLMAGLGAVVGAGILFVAYRPTATFRSLFVVSISSVVIGSYLFLSDDLIIGAIIAALGFILGGRSYQLYQDHR
jgi:hypothetical protein